MPQLTTVQIDTDTRDRLKAIASENERTMAAQIRFMVNQAEQIRQAANPPTLTPAPTPQEA